MGKVFMGKVLDYRRTWMRDWLMFDWLTVQPISLFTPHIYFLAARNIFLCLEPANSQAAILMCWEIKRQDWQESDPNKMGRHQGQAIKAEGRSLVWPAVLSQ